MRFLSLLSKTNEEAKVSLSRRRWRRERSSNELGASFGVVRFDETSRFEPSANTVIGPEVVSCKEQTR